jgi:hypothetical protein
VASAAPGAATLDAPDSGDPWSDAKDGWAQGECRAAPGCVLRGRVRDVSRAIVQRGGIELRGLEVRIDRDPSVPCRAPALPEADVALFLGAGALEPVLPRGAALCGWTRTIPHEIGLPASREVPKWTEGQLADADRRVLFAWSDYFVSTSPLAADWHFAREGKPAVSPFGDGYDYLVSPFVTVRFRTARARVPVHAVAPLAGMSVRAESVLTRGALPIYAAKPLSGSFDGYRFSAVRRPPE